MADDRGFVEHDALAPDRDQGVGRAQVDRHVGREYSEET
jgi:hypothetical protein